MRTLVFVCLAAVPPVSAAAQAAAAALTPAPPAQTRPWSPPRTPDGHPDLQGVWLNNGATPLERPPALASRTTLTDREVADLKDRAARLFRGGANSDFAAGDAYFLALLSDASRFRNTNSTDGDSAMIEREIDNRTSLIVDPADGRIPAMTAEGRTRLSRLPPAAGGARRPSGPEDLSNALRCISYGTPRLGQANTNSAGPLGYYQIVQTPQYVVLFLEAIHEARIITLDGRPHPPDGVRMVDGDSRGHWEGDALVVDTANFSASSNFMGSTEHLHLVERFTRTAPDTLNYVITISDPTTWTKPWTVVVHLKQREEPIYEYACHEGNYNVMQGILSGARADDAAAQNDSGPR
jgi:hypothetical protein